MERATDNSPPNVLNFCKSKGSNSCCKYQTADIMNMFAQYSLPMESFFVVEIAIKKRKSTNTSLYPSIKTDRHHYSNTLPHLATRGVDIIIENGSCVHFFSKVTKGR